MISIPLLKASFQPNILDINCSHYCRAKGMYIPQLNLANNQYSRIKITHERNTLREKIGYITGTTKKKKIVIPI